MSTLRLFNRAGAEMGAKRLDFVDFGGFLVGCTWIGQLWDIALASRTLRPSVFSNESGSSMNARDIMGL